jgi:enoyl-CoA hydratase/carnithine racemase
MTDQRQLADGALMASFDQDILTIILNRPEKRNAVNSEMYAGLAQLLDGAQQDSSVRAVILAASGPDFCAGTDIVDLRSAPRDIPFEDRPVGTFLKTLTSFDKPLIAVVRGRAIGFGLTFLLHCDLVFVTPDAQLSAPFAKLGFSPEAGSSFLLPALVGTRRAFEIFARNHVLSGSEAVEWGIASRAVGTDELERIAAQEVRQLILSPGSALAAVKRLIKPSAQIWAAVGREMGELYALTRSSDAY